MDPIRIELPFEVLPKQTKENVLLRTRRTGKLYMGRKTPAEVKANRDLIVAHAKPLRPGEPFIEPVEVGITCFYPANKDGNYLSIVEVTPMNIVTWENSVMRVRPKTTRPDSDNLAKQLLDALERAGFFKNDAQVADLRVRRFVRCE